MLTMVWERIKGFFKGGDTPAAGGGLELPEVSWLGEEDNPWSVPVLDVRAVTLGLLSTTANPECVDNLASLASEDGRSFVDAEVTTDAGPARPTCLIYRVDPFLADGVLFKPHEMEHKWALYCRAGRIFCVRSWTGELSALAETEQTGELLEIKSLRGAIGEDQGGAFTERVFDFLLRSHALGQITPAPIPEALRDAPQQAALLCMSLYGKMAWFATPEPMPFETPELPLRSTSLIHIAAARGDLDAVEVEIGRGMPLDLLAQDGMAPLHWALAGKGGIDLARRLIEMGSPVDVRTSEGATALMIAVQERSIEQVDFLLAQGADAAAADDRGFTALHRAAEMGQVEIAARLLDHGADPTADADGHTPRSLAELTDQAAILAILDRR